MADISKITLPSGTTYDIKDTQARSDIQDLKTATTAGMHFKGITTTSLTDGATTSPIVIDSENYTPQAGDIVIVGTSGSNDSAPKEFVWTGSRWSEFGSTGSLKALAFKSSASGSYTPEGTVSQPTFTGSSSTVTITSTNNTSGNYQPAGTISQPTFTGNNFTPAGSISFTNSNKTATVSTTTGTATYTPAGSVTTNNKTFAVTGSAVPQNGTANYTPAGSIAVNTAGSTTTIKNPTSKTVVTDMSVADPNATQASGELVYCSVSNETLSLKKFVETTGASITTSNVTVKNGDATYSFTGTGTMLTTETIKEPTGDFSGTGVRLVTGNISVPTSADFSGTAAQVSGTVSQPTFTGTKVQLAGTTTATGSVSQPTFSGTQATITVS